MFFKIIVFKKLHRIKRVCEFLLLIYHCSTKSIDFRLQKFVNFTKVCESAKVCESHRKTPVFDSSLIKVQVLRTAALLKRDSNTGLLLWILLIIQKHVFCVEDL